MYELIPNVSNLGVNFQSINGKTTIHDTNLDSKTYGICSINSTSNSNDLSNLFDNNSTSSWSTLGEYNNKADDPLTSTSAKDNDAPVCGGDTYKQGSCIHNYSGERTSNNEIKYNTQNGGTHTLTAIYPGENIEIIFPKPYYIYESYLEFNDNTKKPKSYWLLGYSEKEKSWKLISMNLNINYENNSERTPINSIDKYKSVKFIIAAGREEGTVLLNKFQLYGSTELTEHPREKYKGFKKYSVHESFSNCNKKKVRFSDEVKNNEKRRVSLIPCFIIFAILGLVIVKKK